MSDSSPSQATLRSGGQRIDSARLAHPQIDRTQNRTQLDKTQIDRTQIDRTQNDRTQNDGTQNGRVHIDGVQIGGGQIDGSQLALLQIGPPTTRHRLPVLANVGILSLLVLLTLSLLPHLALAQNTSMSLNLLDMPEPGAVRAFVRFNDGPPASFQTTPPLPTDFKITGLPQGEAEVYQVQQGTDMPSLIIAAVDHSGSMNPVLGLAFKVLERMSSHVGPQERMGLIFFGSERTSYPTRSNSADLLSDLLQARKLPTGLTTRLVSAIDAAIERAIDEQPVGMREVFIFSDGDEESPEPTIQDRERIVELARNHGVRVSVASYIRRRPTVDQMSWLDWLDKLRAATGGFGLKLAGSPDALVAEIDRSRDLRHQLFAVDARLCGQQSGPVQLPLRVQLSSGDAFTAAAEWSTVLGEEAARECQSAATCNPADCGPHEECVGDACQARTCSVDADCGSGLSCVNSQCSTTPPVPQSILSRRPWLLPLLAILLLALLVLVLLLRRKGENETDAPSDLPLEAAAIPLSQPQPEADSGPELQVFPPEPKVEATGLEELPETHLRSIAGSYVDKRWRLHQARTKVGALDCDITLNIPQLSSQHAEFQLFRSGALYVVDLGSSNGTSVNGVPLQPGQRCALKAGDQVQLSSALLLEVQTPGHVSENPPPTPPSDAPADEERKAFNKKRTIIARGGSS